jgi:hypothetical protein
MPRLPKGKVQLNVYLDKELAEALRRRALLKYGKHYLSRAVEEAIRSWISGKRTFSYSPLFKCPECGKLGSLWVEDVEEGHEVYVEHYERVGGEGKGGREGVEWRKRRCYLFSDRGFKEAEPTRTRPQ